MNEVLNSQYFDLKIPLYNGEVALRGWMQKFYELYEIINTIVQELAQDVPGALLYAFILFMKISMIF